VVVPLSKTHVEFDPVAILDFVDNPHAFSQRERDLLAVLT